jgi:hypothetical protein
MYRAASRRQLATDFFSERDRDASGLAAPRDGRDALL